MVRLDDDVHTDLTRIGMKKEAYGDVIRRLIDEDNKERRND